MISGYFNANRHPCVELTVAGGRGRQTIEAVIDTGFDGDLTLPVQLAIQLGLDLCATQRFELADGSIENQLVFLGDIQLGDIQRTAEVILTDSIDALLGSGPLIDHILEIDYLNRTVHIRPAV